jgi:hypothetical protein
MGTDVVGTHLVLEAAKAELNAKLRTSTSGIKQPG